MALLRLMMAIAFAAVLMAPIEAWPCSYRCLRTSVLMPADGSTDVPLNTRIWIGQLEQESRNFSLFPPRLVEAGSNLEVPLRMSTLSSSQESVLVYTPETRLLPNTTYQLEMERESAPILTFTTGTTEDTTPPMPPTMLSEEVISDTDFEFFESRCGSSSTYGVTYTVSFDGLLVLVDFRRLAEVPLDFGDASAPMMEASNADGTPSQIFIGNSRGCRGSYVEPGTETEVRFGTYDIAGNFSGFTDPLPVKIPSGCGCASGSEAGSVLLLGLAMLRLRKREAH